jgi:hypothetical protein
MRQAVNKEVTVSIPPKSPPFQFQTKAEFNKITPCVQDRLEREASPVTANDSASRFSANNNNTSSISPLASSNLGSTNHINLSPIQMGMGAFPPQMNWPSSPWGWGPHPAFLQPYAFANIFGNGPVPSTSQSQSLVAHNPHLAGIGPNGAPASSPAPSDENTDINDYLSFCHVDRNCESVNKALTEYGITHYQEFENMKSEELEAVGVKKSKARSFVTSIKKYERSLKKRRLNN